MTLDEARAKMADGEYSLEVAEAVLENWRLCQYGPPDSTLVCYLLNRVKDLEAQRSPTQADPQSHFLPLGVQTSDILYGECSYETQRCPQQTVRRESAATGREKLLQLVNASRHS